MLHQCIPSLRLLERRDTAVTFSLLSLIELVLVGHLSYDFVVKAFEIWKSEHSENGIREEKPMQYTYCHDHQIGMILQLCVDV